MATIEINVREKNNSATAARIAWCCVLGAVRSPSCSIFRISAFTNSFKRARNYFLGSSSSTSHSNTMPRNWRSWIFILWPILFFLWVSFFDVWFRIRTCDAKNDSNCYQIMFYCKSSRQLRNWWQLRNWATPTTTTTTTILILIALFVTVITSHANNIRG